MNTHRKAVAGLLLIAAAVTLTGVATTRRAAQAGQVSTTAVAGTPTETRVLSGIIDSFPVHLTSIAITSPPPSALDSIGTDAKWLTATRSTSGSDIERTRERWEALVVTSAYLATCHDQSVTCPKGYTVTSADGLQGGDSSGAIESNIPPTVSQSLSDISNSVKANAAGLGLTGVTVQVWSAGGPVVSVSATATDVKAFLNADRSSLFGGLPISASFIAVYESDGTEAFAEGLDPSIATGVSWTQPGLPTHTL